MLPLSSSTFQLSAFQTFLSFYMHQTVLGTTKKKKKRREDMTCIQGASQLDQLTIFFYKVPDSKLFVFSARWSDSEE